jgi:transcriptional regulator with GAF, ATPase, and Fis domain
MAVQPKLLRVLESRTIRRVGENTYRPIDVRFLSATHRDLLTMVNNLEFREDLYFRVAVVPVAVAALREHREDIPILVNHFLGSTANGVWGQELLNEIANRPWRGNVRELRNFVERARALGPVEALALIAHGRPQAITDASDSSSRIPIPPPLTSDPVATPSVPEVFEKTYKDFREEWIDYGEREYMRRLLRRHDRNVAAAAREAELDRTYIYRLIRKHDL